MKIIKVFYDTNPPEIKSVSINSLTSVFKQNEKEYAKEKDIKFDVEVEDNNKIKNIKYYISDKALSSEELTKKIEQFSEMDVNIKNKGKCTINIDTSAYETEDYFVYITAEDAAGNIQTSNYGEYQFFIDKSLPEVTKIEDKSANKAKWKKPTDELKFEITLEDDETPSGLQYLYKIVKADVAEPSIEASEQWIVLGEKNNDDISYSVTEEIKNNLSDGTYKLWLWVKDGCNNTFKASVFEFHIDGTYPQITEMQYDVRENNEKTTAPFTYCFGSFFRINTVENKMQTAEIKVKASDMVNGSYGADTPSIKELNLYYLTDKEYLQEQAYIHNIKNQQNMPVFGHKEAPYKIENGTFYFRFKVPQKNTFYRVLFVACDNAGNYTYSTPTLHNYGSDLIMLDQDAPLIFMTLDGEYLVPDYVTEEQGETKKWYKGEKDVAYRVRVHDKDSGIFQSILQINGKNVEDNIYSTTSAKSMETEKVYTINSSKVSSSTDGKYEFSIYAKDNAGNVTKRAESIYIDKEKPVITSIKFSDGQTDPLVTVPKQYGYFFKKSTKVTVTVTDYSSDGETLGSGVKNIVYYMKKADGTKTKEKTLKVKQKSNHTYMASFAIPNGFKGQIYIKAIDNVGQETQYYNPKGVVIETSKKHKKLSYAHTKLPNTAYKDNEGNPLYNYMPVLNMEICDMNSGISKSVWSIKAHNDSNPEGEGTLHVQSTYNKKQKKWKASFSGDTKWKTSSKMDLNLVTKAFRKYMVSSEKNHIEAKLKITDNAGYLTKAETSIFSVDMTAPKIEVEFDNNEVFHEKFYNKERHATITVEEANFSKEKCEVKIVGPEVEKSEWEHIAGDGCDGEIHVKNCKWKCIIGFIEDGDYTFSVQCTDLAGWQGDYEEVDEFTIDKTNPVIDVSYDNNDVKNEIYYKKERTATISIVEHNFAPEDVKIIMTAKNDNQEISTPEIKGWSSSEDIHTATIAYNYSGEFTFDIEYTDLANNEAEEFPSDYFIVDLKEPEIIIEGVQHQSANNGNILPVVTCLDTNVQDVQIMLSGANRGRIKCEYKQQKIKGGLIFHLDDIAHKKENDDLYTLSVKVTDKAGSMKENTIMYSVNRFGSVYVLDNDTQKIVDNVYINEEKELHIKEINVDTLTNTKVTYSKDGEIISLSQGSDYTIQQKGQNSSWKEYEYILNKENFQEEGKYIVTIYSQDRATNQSDNKIKGKNIEFVIDKTNPSVLVSGIENKGNYTEDKRSITINVEDNIGLSSVEVFSNNNNIQTFDREQIVQLDGNLTVKLNSSDNWQKIKVIAKDIAGNAAESDTFNVLLTKNMFIQWYRNPWLFYGTILTFVIVIVIFLRTYTKKLKKILNYNYTNKIV